MRAAIVILNWNGIKFLQKYLPAVIAELPPDCTLVVADNGSTDGSLEMDSHACTWNGESLALTPMEFKILWYLCEHRGKVVSSEELYEAVWGEKYLDSNNTVMAHVARIREKMHEQARNPKLIQTVWGVGYKIE